MNRTWERDGRKRDETRSPPKEGALSQPERTEATIQPDSHAVLEELARCHPALARKLDAERREWAPDDLLDTVAMGALGRALVQIVESASVEDLRCIAAVVEDALRGADEDAKDAVATGFLEAVMSGGDSKPEVARFARLLGSEARDYCRAWDEFTGVRTPGIWDDT